MEYSAIFLTFVELPTVAKILVLLIIEWPFYTGFTIRINTVIAGSRISRFFASGKFIWFLVYSICVKRPLSKRPNIGFQGKLLLNAGQKYYRMLLEHSAILSTFIELPFVIKIFVLSIF